MRTREIKRIAKIKQAQAEALKFTIDILSGCIAELLKEVDVLNKTKKEEKPAKKVLKKATKEVASPVKKVKKELKKKGK
jgi:hypothetical protein